MVRVYIPAEENQPEPQAGPVKEGGETFVVESTSKGREGTKYVVSVTFNGQMICTCPGFTYNQKCKHLNIVRERIAQRVKEA